EEAVLSSLSSTAQKRKKAVNHRSSRGTGISRQVKESRQANEATIGRPALGHLDAMLFRALCTWSSLMGHDLSLRCDCDHFGLCPTDIFDLPRGLPPLPLRRKLDRELMATAAP